MTIDLAAFLADTIKMATPLIFAALAALRGAGGALLRRTGLAPVPPQRPGSGEAVDEEPLQPGLISLHREGPPHLFRQIFGVLLLCSQK